MGKVSLLGLRKLVGNVQLLRVAVPRNAIKIFNVLLKIKFSVKHKAKFNRHV